MRKFTLALVFSLFLSNTGFSQVGISSQKERRIAGKTLLLKLLDFPSPPANRSEEITGWLKWEAEKLSGTTNIVPADDAPIEEIIKFWSGKRVFDVPKPSEKTKERLLEALKKDSSLIAPLISFLPTHQEAAEIVSKAYSEAKENGQISSEYDVERWLLFNSPEKREELIANAEKIEQQMDYENKYGTIQYEDELKGFARLDWEKAYPLINTFWGSNRPRLSTLALTLLYRHAAEENSTDAESLREQLKQIVADKTAKGYSRDAAIEALMQTEWQQRDEWFISLFADETLDKITDNSHGYEPLASVVEENPDYWTPKIIKLLDNKDKNVHLAAVNVLTEFDQFQAREDVMKALLPYLEDSKDWRYDSVSGIVYSFNFIDLPESIPVLKKIVQNEDGYMREYAAQALGVRYKAADAAPILEKALMDEPDTNHQEGIIRGLVYCGGLSDEKKIKAIEFYLQNPPAQEFTLSEERHPLIGLGIYLSRFESTDEEFTATILDYADKIQKDKPEISAKTKSLVYAWNNAEANRALVRAIDEGKAAAEDILTAVQKRAAIKKDFYGELKAWVDGGGAKAGIAAVILEDKEEMRKIIDSGDASAQSFLFASARLSEKFVGNGFLISGTSIEVEVALPLEKVNALFGKRDASLAAIEKYLEAEDSETARKLILSQHKGEARIVGRRLPQQFGGGFEELDKLENALRAEILKDKDLEEIFAYRSNIIRIRRGKAEVTSTDYDWDTEKSSTKKYFLPKDKLKKLREGFIKTNPFALKPVSIPSNSCFMQPFASEFIYLTKNGGIRVYMASPFPGFGEEYAALTSFWGSL